MTSPDRVHSFDQDLDQYLDQNLLLLAHGALPLWPRLRVQAHLRRCAECRNRLAQLTQTSALLAAVVRGPGLQPWSRAQAASRASFPIPVRLIALSLAVLVAALCFVAWTHFSTASRPAPPTVVTGCRPDLPNNRCR